MIETLKACGTSDKVLKFMQRYLLTRKQRAHINRKFISERDVIAAIPQGSIDVPLLFNLFLNDLVFFIQQRTLSNYANDKNLFIPE